VLGAIGRINQILRSWTTSSGTPCASIRSALRRFVNWRIIRWLRKRHRWTWKVYRRQYTTATGRWLPIAADDAEVFNLTASVVESPMHGNAHAGFGERSGERCRQQCRHRAPGRRSSAQGRRTHFDSKSERAQVRWST
jgi:hypothetical protein